MLVWVYGEVINWVGNFQFYPHGLLTMPMSSENYGKELNIIKKITSIN